MLPPSQHTVGAGVQRLPLPDSPHTLAHDLLLSSWLCGSAGVAAGQEPQHVCTRVLHTRHAHR